ncbi:MAG: ABC transporter ATP-binding protein [Actinobacteria bacterium]|nr:ABC transporter ATP-binding protein [Actinomycetota bacterium]
MNTHSDSTVLAAVDVAVSYGELEALTASSFSVDKGELIAVVGPNGAGKSTLFKALAGFIDHQGDVVVHGEQCHHLERQAIAYIPQHSDVDLRFPVTVAEVVMAGRRRFHGARMRPSRSDHDHVAECLSQVDLADMGTRSLATLSGGQVQRVLLARALAQEADVLLLDEALSGVDVRHTADLIDLFTQLCSRSTSVLVSTHDLGLVRTHFSRCLTLNGRIIGDGDPAIELGGDRLEAVFSRTSLQGRS